MSVPVSQDFAADGHPAYKVTGVAKDEKDSSLRHRHSVETTQTGQADQALEALGYVPELTRRRSTWQVAFMSFVLASIPYGLATTFYYPLIGGGPVNIIWGWLAVSMIIVCVAASLGEITSVYPTAGGEYHETLTKSPPFTFSCLET
jgi:amino acid permease